MCCGDSPSSSKAAITRDMDMGGWWAGEGGMGRVRGERVLCRTGEDELGACGRVPERGSVA
eukprot:1463642-Prymnesium_polylepis.1